METSENTIITVESTVNVPVEKAWDVFTNTKHIPQWNHASDDWHSPSAQNDLRPGGTFSYRMEAKDGSFGFDFGGTFVDVKPNELLSYTIGDGRKVENVFTKEGGATKITVTFEAENQNSVEMQKGGWQAIMDNYKKYAESL
ncbi:MAG TPA: SRPBCC family protein [Mucilaginibacter sp.]|jgi:uncharacterized protein YndB with AHSA1/START domain|nr:SRPBCC family protein [Mucilaginibacter sp.]